MFQPKALHLALAASAALAISAGVRSQSARNADSDATITTSNKAPSSAPDIALNGDSDATFTTSNAPARAPAPGPAPGPAPCQVDLTGDRRIDVLDLIEVLIGWGTCATEPDFGPFPIDDTDTPRLVNRPRGKDSAGLGRDNGGARAADDADFLGQVLPCQGDINRDGYVDVRDMVEVMINFGSSCP